MSPKKLLQEINYKQLVKTFGLKHLGGKIDGVYLEGKFCLMDNFSDENPVMTPVNDALLVRFPVKISLGFCAYCKRGWIKVRVQQKDYVVKAGSALVIFPGQILEYNQFSPDCKLLYIAANSEYMTTNISSRYGRALRQWILQGNEPLVLHPSKAQAENYEQLCMCMKNMAKSPNNEFVDGILSGFTAIYGNLLLNWWEQSQPLQLESNNDLTTHSEKVLYQFQNDVHNFAAKFRSVSYYAMRQGISVRHFSRLVAEASGRSASEIIRDYVILEAKSLLLTGRYTVLEVSEELNFVNDSYFNRYFKAAVGLTPGEFLKIN